jgi:hypothetical protein
LISIREKIQHYKPPGLRVAQIAKENETAKLFQRRLSVIPTSLLKVKESASAFDVSSLMNRLPQNEVTSTQSDIVMSSQSEIEDPQTPASSSTTFKPPLQIESVKSLHTDSTEFTTPTTAIVQQRGKRISFNDDNNESGLDLMVPSVVETSVASTSTVVKASNNLSDAVFKAPLGVAPKASNANKTGPNILKGNVRKLPDNRMQNAGGVGGGKRLCVEHPHQGKNLVGYKVSIQKRSPLDVYCNKNDGSPKIYGFARNVAFAVVLCDNQRKNIFKCHIPNCTYQIMNEKLMEKHIQLCHRGQTWNGYCAKCSKLFFFPEKENDAATMLDEFDHVKEVHLGCKKETRQTIEPIENNVSNATVPSTSGKNMAAFQSISGGKNMQAFQMNLNTGNSQGFRNRSMTHTPRACLDPRINRNLHDSPEVTSEQFYNAIDTINLRPWFSESQDLKKSKAAAMAMLHEEPLTAFYKCMQKNCVYFSCDADNFRRHMTLHKSFNNLCCYCSYNNASVDNLMKHYQDEHFYDSYQCAFCFYRSFSEGNLITHAKRYHDNKASIVIIECMRRGYKENRDRLYMEARSYESFSKFVSMFECPCGAKFYLFNDFEKHLKEHGNRDLQHPCKNCRGKILLKDLIEHNEKCLKQSCIQCIHCHYGCQNTYKIFDHLTNQHASKVPMYCDRIQSSGSVN